MRTPAVSLGKGCCDMPLKSLAIHSGPWACETAGCGPLGPAWLAVVAGGLPRAGVADADADADPAGAAADDGDVYAASARALVCAVRCKHAERAAGMLARQSARQAMVDAVVVGAAVGRAVGPTRTRPARRGRRHLRI